MYQTKPEKGYSTRSKPDDTKMRGLAMPAVSPFQNNLIQKAADEDQELMQAKFQDVSKTDLGQTSGVVQRVPINGINVVLSGSMPQWDQDGLTYHLNLTTDPPHVTCENWPAKKGTTKMHFFFQGSGADIKNAVSGQRGKKKFSELPAKVQTFVRGYYTQILAVT